MKREYKEYIEREAAKARLRIWITDCVLYGDNDEADCFRRCIDLIDSIPATDVPTVRHGRWLCADTDTEQFFLCNRCKKKEYWESDYCPNCGAKMDGEGV